MRCCAIFGVMALLGMAAAAQAQNSPRIGYVYPAGGQRGTTFQVVVGGQYLDGAAGAWFSGKGVQAVVVGHTKPMSQREFSELRDKLKVLQDKKRAATNPGNPATGGSARADAGASVEPNKPPEWTAEDEKTMMEIKRRLVYAPNRQANPAISERVKLAVTLAPDAEVGQREVRLTTPAGLTNPVLFCVGELPEFSEKEVKEAEELELENPRAARTAVTTEMTVTLPAVLNGQILPGGADRFRFAASKGQHLVVVAGARELIPYLPDAVPGWFQATLALYDKDGRELAYDDDYRFNPDPVLHFVIPADGEYTIEIKDSIYRGREDFVYRIAAGQLPFVTSAFPLGARAGTQATVKLRGWNLPADTLTPGFGEAEAGIHQLCVRADERSSNLVPFAVDTLPEYAEQESNDTPENAQSVTTPAIINGRIDRSGDSDVFRFEGRAGSEIVAEVYARRLNSPVDSSLRLVDAAGRQLAANDDSADKGAGLTTHHADSYLRATLPSDGTYYLHLADAQNKGGPEYAYRLRLSAPRPDFELRVVPSSINVRAGTAAVLTVYALRKDGFAGDITLALKDAPAGLVLDGGWVPSGQEKMRVTLTVPPTPAQEPLSLALEGRATIDGREVVHPAVPAEDMMQAFFYRHLVPARELRVAVSQRVVTKSPARIVSSIPVKIPVGGTARVQLAGSAGLLMGKVEFELSEPPEGIAIEGVEAGSKPGRPGQGVAIVLRSDAAKVKPGLKGNLIVNVFTARLPASGSEKPQASRPRVPSATLPAIAFEVVTR